MRDAHESSRAFTRDVREATVTPDVYFVYDALRSSILMRDPRHSTKSKNPDPCFRGEHDLSKSVQDKGTGWEERERAVPDFLE